MSASGFLKFLKTKGIDASNLYDDYMKEFTDEMSKYVLLSISHDGYGACVETDKVMTKVEWDKLKQKLSDNPKVGISNESIGGRTSDDCINAGELVEYTTVDTDPNNIYKVLEMGGCIGQCDIYETMEDEIDDSI